MRMTRPSYLSLAAAVLLFSGCVSAELGRVDFEGEPLFLDVIIAPDAEVHASYDIVFDAENPVRTIVSIGTSAAKAAQVEKTRERLDGAMRRTDIPGLLEEEIAVFFSRRMDMRIVERRSAAEFELTLDVKEYGIMAGGGAEVELVLNAVASMYADSGRERIWRRRVHASEQVSPAFFGLPPSAGNVLSAAMLSELTEDEIAAGLERVAREASRELGAVLQRDIYRAKRMG